MHFACTQYCTVHALLTICPKCLACCSYNVTEQFYCRGSEMLLSGLVNVAYIRGRHVIRSSASRMARRSPCSTMQTMNILAARGRLGFREQVDVCRLPTSAAASLFFFLLGVYIRRRYPSPLPPKVAWVL